MTPIGSAGSAFGRPARGTFGDMGRNELHGPGFWNVDASLFKRFGLGGDRNLEFRVEAQNVFNHVNLGQPERRDRRAGEQQHERGLHHGHGRHLPAAQPAVRPEVRILVRA